MRTQGSSVLNNDYKNRISSLFALDCKHLEYAGHVLFIFVTHMDSAWNIVGPQSWILKELIALQLNIL